VGAREDALEGSPVKFLVVDYEDVGVSQGARASVPGEGASAF
jgi:hypothetical protein